MKARPSLWTLYGEKSNTVAYGGPGLRYPRGSVIEEIAYLAKWAFPAALLAFSALALLAARRTERRHREHAAAEDARPSRASPGYPGRAVTPRQRQQP